jgi:hypothetical protein
MSDLKLPGDVLEDAYITALLFTETDEDGVHLDVNWTAGDIDAAALVTLMHDARAFYLACADLIKDENLRGDNTAYPALDMAGHDLAMTKNGHGVGFWDGGWKEDVGKILTYAAKAQGERHLYVENGRIYVS